MDSVCQVIGCLSTQEWDFKMHMMTWLAPIVRVQNTYDDVASTIHQSLEGGADGQVGGGRG
jgi:hypothetical protein